MLPAHTVASSKQKLFLVFSENPLWLSRYTKRSHTEEGIFGDKVPPLGMTQHGFQRRQFPIHSRGANLLRSCQLELFRVPGGQVRKFPVSEDSNQCLNPIAVGVVASLVDFGKFLVSTSKLLKGGCSFPRRQLEAPLDYLCTSYGQGSLCFAFRRADLFLYPPATSVVIDIPTAVFLEDDAEGIRGGRRAWRSLHRTIQPRA